MENKMDFPKNKRMLELEAMKVPLLRTMARENRIKEAKSSKYIKKKILVDMILKYEVMNGKLAISLFSLLPEDIILELSCLLYTSPSPRD